jgi:homoserine dehydrogenase
VSAVKEVRICVVGCGTVGQWLLRALAAHAARLATRYNFVPVVVGLATARHGLIYNAAGLDLPTLLTLAANGRPLTEHPSVVHWPTALAGLGTLDADVLVEVTASPAVDGEPGASHMREALRRHLAVVTSNKWPVALHGVELAQLARRSGVAFRAEATVMSGTPVLSTLLEGLAGATPVALRGILNATSNFILSEMSRGASYADALSTAQAAGLTERDPTADVDGHDAVAKLMILAGLVFGRQLRVGQVARQSIAQLDRAAIEAAAAAGAHIRPLASLEFAEPGGGGGASARVQPMPLGPADPLAGIDGVSNAVVCRADPLGTVTIIGPGAGVALAGQGVLADLIAIARRPAR